MVQALSTEQASPTREELGGPTLVKRGPAPTREELGNPRPLQLQLVKGPR